MKGILNVIAIVCVAAAGGGVGWVVWTDSKQAPKNKETTYIRVTEHGEFAEDEGPLIAEHFVAANQAKGVHDDEPVVGVVLHGEARAYPVRYFFSMEHINDQIGDTLICATWCPLTATGAVHQRQVNNQKLTFMSSGKLYRQNLVLMDLETKSHWSQLGRRSIGGKMRGALLPLVPSIHTTWKHWKTMYPQTKVIDLWRAKGPFKDFGMLMSPLNDEMLNRNNIHHFEVVLGVVFDEGVKAYPISRLAKKPTPFVDKIGPRNYHVHFHPHGPAAWVTDLNGQLQAAVTSYWENWVEFYPHTLLYDSNGGIGKTSKN